MYKKILAFTSIFTLVIFNTIHWETITIRERIFYFEGSRKSVHYTILGTSILDNIPYFELQTFFIVIELPTIKILKILTLNMTFFCPKCKFCLHRYTT